MTEVMIPLEHFHRFQELHRYELADMQARLIRYRALLDEHGIEPPDDSGKVGLQELRKCRQMMEAAYEAVLAAEDFRDYLGSSGELLRRERW